MERGPSSCCRRRDVENEWGMSIEVGYVVDSEIAKRERRDKGQFCPWDSGVERHVNIDEINADEGAF